MSPRDNFGTLNKFYRFNLVFSGKKEIKIREVSLTQITKEICVIKT